MKSSALVWMTFAFPLLELCAAANAIQENRCTELRRRIPEYAKCNCTLFEAVNIRGMNRVNDNRLPTAIGEPTSLVCKNQAFDEETSARMLQYVFLFTPDVAEIIFTGNKMPHLPKSLFGDREVVVLSKVRLLDLSNNGITTIHEFFGAAFTSWLAPRSEGVRTLILDDNALIVDEQTSRRLFVDFGKLRVLSLNSAFSSKSRVSLMSDLGDIFKGSWLLQLEELYLEKNGIHVMNAKPFKHLPALRKLSLRYNDIWSISGFFSDALAHGNDPDQWNLQELDLYRNPLRHVSPIFIKALLSMSRFKSLNIHESQMICDCEMARVRTLLSPNRKPAQE